MTVGEVINTALKELGYPATQAVRDACTKRFIGYVYDACTTESWTNPVVIEQDAVAEGGIIYASTLKHSLILGFPTITQNGERFKVKHGYGLPVRYHAFGIKDGPVKVKHGICAPPLSLAEDDLGEFAVRAESIIRFVIMSEKIYRNNRGTPMRLKTLNHAQESEALPEDPTEGTVFYSRQADALYLITFKCPCGCGITERVNAYLYENGISSFETRSKETKYDKYGAPYTYVKYIAPSVEGAWGFVVRTGKFTLTGHGRKNCNSAYTITDNQIEWRYPY